MLRFVSDENFNDDIVAGLIARIPTVEVIGVRDTPLSGASDLDILEWAADRGRVVLTHDRQTFPRFALDRVREGLSMPGVVVVSSRISVGDAIRELAVVVSCGEPSDFDAQVVYVPLT